MRPHPHACPRCKYVKVFGYSFMSLYLLNKMMDQVDAKPVVRYWSEVSVGCNIMTHPGNLEVKVTDLEILYSSFLLKFLEIYIS